MKDFSFEVKSAFFRRKLGAAEHREFQILEKALQITYEEGFEGLQFAALAKKCKISRPLIHHYFKTRLDLAERLLELTTLHLKNYVTERFAKEGGTHLELYCRASLDWPAEHRVAACGLLIFVQVSSSAELLRKRNDELSAVGKETIKALLIEAGSRSDLPYKSTAIQCILTGCCLNLITENLTKQESLALRRHGLKACMEIAKVK